MFMVFVIAQIVFYMPSGNRTITTEMVRILLLDLFHNRLGYLIGILQRFLFNPVGAIVAGTSFYAVYCSAWYQFEYLPGFRANILNSLVTGNVITYVAQFLAKFGV